MTLKPVFYRAASFLLPGAPHRVGERNRREVGFVVMHGVHPPRWTATIRPPSSSIGLDDLDTNLRALGRDYSVISIDEGTEMLAGRIPFRPRCVVLTFDDSLKCHLDVVAPMLVRLGLTATFFLSTEIIDSRRPYWWLRVDYALAKSRQPAEAAAELKRHLRVTPAVERDAVVAALEEESGARLQDSLSDFPFADILTWSEVRRLHAMSMTIGSHTVTHSNLALLPPDEVRFELHESRDRLERVLGVPCRHCCYPYGSHTSEVREVARTCGYTSAVTTRGPGWNPASVSRWELRRFTVPGEPYKLPYMLSGLEEVINRLRHY